MFLPSFQLTEINAKWDDHCKELQAAHDNELANMRKKAHEDQALLEREAQEALKQLKKRILSLEVSNMSVRKSQHSNFLLLIQFSYMGLCSSSKMAIFDFLRY